MWALAVSTIIIAIAHVGDVSAFSNGVVMGGHTPSSCRQSSLRFQRGSALHNVPPPSTSTDPAVAKDGYDREEPPQSFYQLQIQSSAAAKRALQDGYKLIEVEFPPLPANVLDSEEVSAYEVLEANLKLAIDFSKFFAQDGLNVAVLLPDEAELKIALERLDMAMGLRGDEPYPGVKVSSLRRSEEGDERIFKPEQVLLSLFGRGSGGVVKPMEGTDMYVVIVASAQELPDVEELQQVDPDKTIVLYNLKLDVLRGDLGAPAFPGKDFQDRFLSRVKPVYYLRTRQYSRSTSRPPFLVNYQGCLFRSYPGQYQTLLDTGKGAYRRVTGGDFRPALGEFKEQLTKALQTEGVIEDEGQALSFLRTGYKTTTWWEEEREDASNDWRT